MLRLCFASYWPRQASAFLSHSDEKKREQQAARPMHPSFIIVRLLLTRRIAKSKLLEPQCGFYNRPRTLWLAVFRSLSRRLAIRSKTTMERRNLVDVTGIEPATPCLQRRERKSI